MGKGNMLLGRLRKSVGDLTFRVSEGEQIVSAKAKTVRNPKTMNQRVQRAIFATASQLASSLYSLVNHSFEGETRTNGSLRAFRKNAIADLRKFYEDGDGSLCLNPKNTTNPEPNQVIVAKGRLGALDVEYYSTGAGEFRVGGVVAGMNDRDNVTFAQLKSAFGIEVKGGDEIAIATIINRRGIISAQLNRVVLVSGISDTDTVLTSDNLANCGFNPMVIQPDKTVGGNVELLQQDVSSDGSINVAVNAANTTLLAAAVVVSHYDTERGMWIYTTSRMGVDANFFASYDNDAAIASYGDATAAAPQSDYFLDQSTRSSNIPIEGVVKFWARGWGEPNFNTELLEASSATGTSATVAITPRTQELDNLKINIEAPKEVEVTGGNTAKFKKVSIVVTDTGEKRLEYEFTKYSDIGLLLVELTDDYETAPLEIYVDVHYHVTGVSDDYIISAYGAFTRNA